MKVGLQTWGTDGDFYPFLALSIGLKEAGHEVTLAYTSVDGKDYSGLTSDGIRLLQVNGDVRMPENENPYSIAAKPGSYREYSKLLELYFDPFAEVMYQASAQLCKENDLVVGHAVCHTLLTASQKFACPRVSLVLTPLVVRSNFVSPIGMNLGRILNSMIWSVGGKISTWSWFRTAKAIRKREGLASISSLQKELFTSDLLTIVAASEALFPRPNDWHETVKMTGFLNLKSSTSDWQIPKDLKEFLDTGEAPIFMTFGSCMQFTEEASTKLLIESAKLSGKRAIFQSSWNGSAFENDPRIFQIGHVPHSEVYPLCSLIVHHGGAGTTQAALLAGKPSVVVAHGFDQPYWATQLKNSGAGGNVLHRNSVTPHMLASTIIQTIDSIEIAKKASDIGQQMKNENGIDNAVQLIDKLIVA